MHVLLLCEAVTLAHSARVAVLARALAARGHRVTVAGAAPLTRFEHPGVAWRELGCIGTERFVAALASGQSAYTEADLQRYVAEERQCIDDIAPDVVAADFRPTAAVSARRAGVPCAAIINAYWSPAAGSDLPMPVLPFTRWLPLPIAQRLFDLGSKWALASFCRPWNRVRVANGLEDLGADLRRIYCDGDAVLYPDVPGMFIDGDPPAHHHYLGPLLWSPEVALPAWWPDLPRDRPIAYLTLGSSGDPRLFDTVVAGLRAAGLAVVATTAGAATGSAGQGPDVFTAPYLPGDAATAAADLVVCNGGAMTCQQAFACGKPVLGIAGNMDQFLNMAGVAAAGAGALIRADRLSAPGVALAAGALTGERRFREASSRLGSRMDPATPALRFERAVERLATGAQAPARAGPPVATAGMRGGPGGPGVMLRTARAAGAPTMDDDVRYSTPRHGTLPMTTDDMLRQEWDVIVVGTGMGGATIGHALARAGRRVLFCELGGATHGQLRGGYPELDQGRSGAVLDGSQRALLAGAGRCGDTLVDASTSRPRRFVPFIGGGRGGSSALYGMALERFARADFEPGAYHCGADGAAVAERWPIGYDELAPWYAAAEALYRVRGEPDPLAAAPGGSDGPALMPPPPLSSAAGELRGFLAGRGLHPYQLPAACEHVAGCQSCQGLLCPMPCKNDADRICLQPALAEHGAALLEGCRVLAVTTEGRRARGVDCHWSGREWHLRARTVVLAAGALQTPLILRRSDGGRGQPGLGNRSGLVGRHLMRHLIDLYLVRPADASAPDFDNRRKEIAFNDFYADGGDKLGTVQSFGRLPPAGMLFGALQDDVRASRWGWAAPALGLARPLLRPILHDMSEGWLTLAAIIEDLPYADHRVEPDAAGPETARLHYRLRPEAHRRVARLRGHMAGVLQGRKWRRLPQVDNNQRIAHACGTCRFGDDPRTSVLDRDNRVHDVDNLFVVDSSFFPSSAGTNPSLTIAANALRVAQRIVEQGP